MIVIVYSNNSDGGNDPLLLTWSWPCNEIVTAGAVAVVVVVVVVTEIALVPCSIPLILTWTIL